MTGPLNDATGVTSQVRLKETCAEKKIRQFVMAGYGMLNLRTFISANHGRVGYILIKTRAVKQQRVLHRRGLSEYLSEEAAHTPGTLYLSWRYLPELASPLFKTSSSLRKPLSIILHSWEPSL